MLIKVEGCRKWPTCKGHRRNPFLVWLHGDVECIWIKSYQPTQKGRHLALAILWQFAQNSWLFLKQDGVYLSFGRFLKNSLTAKYWWDTWKLLQKWAIRSAYVDCKYLFFLFINSNSKLSYIFPFKKLMSCTYYRCLIKIALSLFLLV